MHVLLIDDSKTVRIQVRKILLSAGCTVTEAGSADEGLAHLRGDAKVDVVITDQIMPEKTGLEMLEEWNKSEQGINKDTVILFMSSDDSSDARLAAMSLGAKGYISKPVQSDALLEVVRKYG